ncbi:EAL domain-containing protein [Actinoplanes sp. Pm04-4]|uniref:EAL domain-containing protein n=1 Tax=Paractinoplanes pyxinae TaxID=2997416 RepID=A0ABT4BJG6_9ACTN|nr:EAL domain-containing protein [Actinoplanes pyxinae]MCY1145753.1 EAL domain-containing protein [Actinoplanes pyxinae]
MDTTPAPVAGDELPFDVLLQNVPGALQCVYQSFVDVDSGSVLAYEALLRGPAGTLWESPLALLDAARTAGRLADLECASLRASLADAAWMTGGSPVTLFVNIEPRTLTRDLDVVLRELAARPDHVQVVVEITERALAEDLAGVLKSAEQLRSAGCGIALDDVGAEPASLAFIPLLRPEVIKLDLLLLRTITDPAAITVAGAVRAYAEESGAEVVAEGVETSADLTRALVLGATLGQGWLWDRGVRQLRPTVFDPERFAARPVVSFPHTTPYDLIGTARKARRAPKKLLVPMTKTLEMMALHARVPPVLLAGFQRAEFFRPSIARRYADLAAHLPYVGAFGTGMPTEPAPGVRGTALSTSDPLTDGWAIVILGAHTSAALVARDLGDIGPDDERSFEFVVTYDRNLVTMAAHAMVGRLSSS